MVILIQCHNTYLIQLYAYRFNFHFRRYCVNSNMDTYTVYSGTSSTYWKTRLQNLAFVLFCTPTGAFSNNYRSWLFLRGCGWEGFYFPFCTRHCTCTHSLTIIVCPSHLTTFEQLSMPVVAVWYSSKELSFSLLNIDVFPTPSSPRRTTLYVGPRLGAAAISLKTTLRVWPQCAISVFVDQSAEVAGRGIT